MNIVLIGTGNTATVLGKKLVEAGQQVTQVFGRNESKASQLANELHTVFTTEVDAVTRTADIYLIAVPDDSVEEVAGSLSLTDQVVVHTAASVSLDVLKGKAKQYGVLYPLQSMRKELLQLPEMPVLVDASDAQTLQLLKTLAGRISENVLMANDVLRVKMHMAAVMVNNFSNHLFALVEKYCRQEGLDFSLLLPLIRETVARLDVIDPSEAQTGPALRNDMTTISKHLSLLENTPELKKLYSLFTESIQRSRS